MLGPRRSALRWPPAPRSFETPTRATAPPLPAARQRKEASLSPAASQPPGASRWPAALATAGSVAVAGSVATSGSVRGGRQPRHSRQLRGAGERSHVPRSGPPGVRRNARMCSLHTVRCLRGVRRLHRLCCLRWLCRTDVAQSAHAVSGVFGDPCQRRRSGRLSAIHWAPMLTRNSRERTERGNRTTRHRRFQERPIGCRCSIAPVRGVVSLD